MQLQFRDSDTIKWEEKFGNFTNDINIGGTLANYYYRFSSSGTEGDISSTLLSVSNLQIGDYVLIIDLIRNLTPNWMLNVIEAISGNTVTWKYPLTNEFNALGSQVVKAVTGRNVITTSNINIPTVNDTNTDNRVWNNQLTGGIGLIIASESFVSTSYTINGNGLGLKGGLNHPKWTNGGYPQGANGGSTGNCCGGDCCAGHGAGGGSYESGGNSWSSSCGSYYYGGSGIQSQNLINFCGGSGGGSGYCEGYIGGWGGNAGASLLIISPTINLGTVNLNGNNGSNNGTAGGSGGGGKMLLIGSDVSISTVNKEGGSSNGGGGAGGRGQVTILYCNSYSGSTSNLFAIENQVCCVEIETSKTGNGAISDSQCVKENFNRKKKSPPVRGG